MTHNAPWSSTFPGPGCLIFLLDQSGSMEDPFTASQVGSGRKKCDVVATILNKVINDVIHTNTKGTKILLRADIAVIGYGNNKVESCLPPSLAAKKFVTLDELKNSPLRTEIRMSTVMDDTGKIVEIPEAFPIWVEAKSEGNTPMCEALKLARTMAEDWAGTHTQCYPPVIVNVTDGVATDGKEPDITAAAKALRDVSTKDGNALLFTCHVPDEKSGMPSTPVEYPDTTSMLSDPYAKLLFTISSEIPESGRTNLAALGKVLPTGAKGFIYNGDAASISMMFTFASLKGTGDENR